MFWCDFIAGWIGGSAGIAVGHPFDTLKVRQQSPNGGGGGGGGAVTLWAAARDCGKYEGVSSKRLIALMTFQGITTSKLLSNLARRNV